MESPSLSEPPPQRAGPAQDEPRCAGRDRRLRSGGANAARLERRVARHIMSIDVPIPGPRKGFQASNR